MTDADCHWSLSNPGPDKLIVWLEPWAEEFDVPVRSTVKLKSSGGARSLGEVEWASEHLIIWASAQTVEVFIDGVFQESGSAVIPIPDGLTKEMLNILFADQPDARLGGTSPVAIDGSSRWKRLRRRFGL